MHLEPIYFEEWGILDIFRTLADKFVMVNYHMTNWQCRKAPLRHLKSTVFEYVMVNKKHIKLNSLSRSFKEHPLNLPNQVVDPLCPMTDED